MGKTGNLAQIQAQGGAETSGKTSGTLAAASVAAVVDSKDPVHMPKDVNARDIATLFANDEEKASKYDPLGMLVRRLEGFANKK